MYVHRADFRWYETNRPPLPAATRQYYVYAGVGSDSNPGTEARPWLTLEKARTAMNAAGDHLYCRGTFSGDYWAPAQAGNARAWMAIRNWPGYTATLEGKPSVNTSPVYAATGRDYLWIEGLTLPTRGQANGGVGPAVFLRSADGATDHVTIINCHGITADESGLLVDGISNLWIEGCTFSTCGSKASNAGSAIFYGIPSGAANVSDVTIYRNTVADAGHMGIECSAVGGATLSNERVAANTITNTWSGGIAAAGNCSGRIVEGNDIFSSGTDNADAGSRNGLFVMGTSGVYRYNRIIGSAREQVFFQGSYTASVLQQCQNNQVYHNFIFGGLDGAVMIAIVNVDNNQATLLVTGNKFWNNICLDNLQTAGLNYGGSSLYDLSVWANTGHATAKAVFGLPSTGPGHAQRTLGTNNDFSYNVWRASRSVAFGLQHVAIAGDGGTLNYTAAQAATQFGAQFASSVFADPGACVDTASRDLGAVPMFSAASGTGRAIDGVPSSHGTPDMGCFDVWRSASRRSRRTRLRRRR